MSFFDNAIGALKELPISDIQKARLELASDMFAKAESQIGTLQQENTELKIRLKQAEADRDVKVEELKVLKEFHKEDVHVIDCLEFRRGVRTGGKWLAFCPKCHLPSRAIPDGYLACSDESCSFVSSTMPRDLPRLLAQLPAC